MNHLDKARNERVDFLKGKLANTSHTNPVPMFKEWYQEAGEEGCVEPNTVVLSTATPDGKPSSRIVYMRDLLPDGEMIIYTNYNSRKGEEVIENPNVSLLFYWNCLERQVRLEGKIEKASAEISDAYFDGRPRISQIGSWASEQSTEIESRATLEERIAYFEKKFPNKVPRPPHWGGYLFKATYFEFWQGRLGRLHDRICFDKQNEDWRIFRIAP